jgi:hypothetical protein
MTIDALRTVLPPPASPVDPGDAGRWADIERQVGTPLPSDYKEFVAVYGAGKIGDLLLVLNPFARNKHLNLLVQIERHLEALRELRETGEDSEYTLFPEPGGLLPWGFSENGDILLWLTEGKPDLWPVVVNVGREPTYERFDMSMTDFLARVLTHQVRSEALPEDFPGQRPTFVPAAI